APAFKLSGQIISHVLTELEITCLPGDLPQFIEVDLSKMIGGSSLHLSEITLPKGVKHVTHGAEGDLVLASALPKPGADVADAAAGEGAAEYRLRPLSPAVLMCRRLSVPINPCARCSGVLFFLRRPH